MILLPEDQWAVSGALADVQAAATGLSGIHTEDQLKQSLLAVRHASMKAYGLLDEAAKRAREAALAHYKEIAA